MAKQVNGFIPWAGGPCPVDEDSFPEVITADGERDCERASDFQWEWSDEHPLDNVIAYRLIDRWTRAEIMSGITAEQAMEPHSLLQDIPFMPAPAVLPVPSLDRLRLEAAHLQGRLIVDGFENGKMIVREIEDDREPR
tara:strand:- start:68 stop:481 length:414 start_codon:yes stop_codon:yes gene_type:complete